ncbi:hypothetical protein Y032_0035g2977 [Ancylostoma ceylanicum]|uniref:Peptidase A2 domain-containing protein n=1 Tax=Ancylostoma ceylanicum TaxID=53326 RepID=A0A016UMT1_9BILA|nr:hypothetical protein Y032_0035g2977 [Ancylostoma ceylanicum]
MSEKQDIMTEIEQIENESQLHAATAEANDLIVILSARLGEYKNICENVETYDQKVYAPTEFESNTVRNSAESTEQNRSGVSFSQTVYASQNRGGSMAFLKKEIAAKANVANRSGQKSIGEVMQSRRRNANYRPNYGKGCIFCQKGNHLSTRCRTVSDQSMRRRALREQNRCWKCFSPNHSSFVCHKQDCSYCGQKHHNSLCFKKEALQVNYGKERKVITVASNRRNTRNWQNRGQIGNDNQPIRTKLTPVAVQMCAGTVLESNICPPKTTNRQIVLMTAEGSIWNAKRRQFERVSFLFDSGSQKTVIEEKLAEQFGLPKVRTQMCTVSGNGGHTETFKSHIVLLKIGTVFGEDIKTVVETRPVITNGFPSVRLDQNDAAFLKANDIYLANTKIRGEHQIPRILIGLDYYHDLITGYLTKALSGLHIAKTVFGPIIYGSGFTEVNHIESVIYNLTAVWENAERLKKSPGLIIPVKRQRRKKLAKYLDVADSNSVARRRLQSPQPQPSAANSSRHRPTVHVKPPSTPSVRRSPPTPAIRRHPPRPRAVPRYRSRQEVDRRITTRKKAKTSDTVYDYSCRPPEYHRQIDDPHSICAHRPYCSSCGGGGTDPSYARYDTY